jgi:hypothetical protein
MLSGYKKQSSEWLLDEIIKEANEVEFPSDSNLLFELRSELLSRLTKDAPDAGKSAASDKVSTPAPAQVI